MNMFLLADVLAVWTLLLSSAVSWTWCDVDHVSEPKLNPKSIFLPLMNPWTFLWLILCFFFFCEQQQKQVKIRSTSRSQHEPWIRSSELYRADQTETDAFNGTDALNLNVLITISVVQIKSHSKPAVLLLWPHKCFGLQMRFRSPTSHQLFSNAHISFNQNRRTVSHMNASNIPLAQRLSITNHTRPFLHQIWLWGAEQVCLFTCVCRRNGWSSASLVLVYFSLRADTLLSLTNLCERLSSGCDACLDY